MWKQSVWLSVLHLETSLSEAPGCLSHNHLLRGLKVQLALMALESTIELCSTTLTPAHSNIQFMMDNLAATLNSVTWEEFGGGTQG